MGTSQFRASPHLDTLILLSRCGMSAVVSGATLRTCSLPSALCAPRVDENSYCSLFAGLLHAATVQCFPYPVGSLAFHWSCSTRVGDKSAGVVPAEQVHTFGFSWRRLPNAPHPHRSRRASARAILLFTPYGSASCEIIVAQTRYLTLFATQHNRLDQPVLPDEACSLQSVCMFVTESLKFGAHPARVCAPWELVAVGGKANFGEDQNLHHGGTIACAF